MRKAEATGALRAGRLTEETFEWLEVDKELEVLSVNGAYRVAGHERTFYLSVNTTSALNIHKIHGLKSTNRKESEMINIRCW